MTKRLKFIYAAIILLVLSGCNSEEPAKEEEIHSDWKESTLFVSEGFTMIGDEGRLGFIYDDSEVVRFYPEKTQKYMWHFWGEADELIGDFKVVGMHENSDKKIMVIPKIENPFLSPLNGADQHFPTNMTLPASGMRKLDALIGDNLIGSVYVKVYEE